MGFFYELVVNFGQNEVAMAAATDEVQRSTVQIRGINVPLKSSWCFAYRSEGQQLIYYEFSTWPLGLSHPVGAGHWAKADLFPPFLPEELSDQDLSTVAEQLSSRRAR